MIFSRPIVTIALAVLLAGVLVPDGSSPAAQRDPDCPRWRRAFEGMPPATVVIVTTEGRRFQTTAKLAATDEARWAGFQCATRDEIKTTVIVFDFHGEVMGGFHMQNVPAALDIAFVKASGQVFSILPMEPSPSARYGPLGAYRYAIEARLGFFKEHGIAQGDRVVAVEAKR